MEKLKYIIVLITFLAFDSCGAKEGKENSNIGTKELDCISYTYSINDKDGEFGLKYYSDVAVVQPRSILIEKDYVYIPDPLKRVVKRITIADGAIMESSKLPEDIGELYDIICFNNQIILTTYNGCIVYFDKELEEYKIIRLSQGKGKFYELTEDSYSVYFPSDEFKTFKIGHSGDVLETQKGAVSFKNIMHGKKIIVESEGKIIKTANYKFHLKNKYNRLKYGGINIDANENLVSYYTIENNELKLVVCKK